MGKMYRNTVMQLSYSDKFLAEKVQKQLKLALVDL